MSQPAAMQPGTASLRFMAAAKPIMCEASVMVRPFQPSWPFSRSVSSSGARVAGMMSSSVNSGRSFLEYSGSAMWPTMIECRPSSISVR